MRVQKLESTDGFVVWDLDGASAAGATRLAPKVLVDGAQLLARSTTYTFAAFGLRLGGGSAGINAKPEIRDAAVAAYVDEVGPLSAEKRWVTWPGVGVTEADLAPLETVRLDPAQTAEGALAAAEAVLGALGGKRISVSGSGPVAKAATAAAKARGLSPGVDDERADAVLVAGKAGVVDHENAAEVEADVLVPLTPVPVTAKGFAVLGRAGTVVVPDFLSIAAPLLAAFDPAGGDPVDRVREAVAQVAGEGAGVWMAAVERAEAFLSSWQETLPFGRPLA